MKYLLLILPFWLNSQCSFIFPNDTVICFGTIPTLQASGGNMYSWGYNSVVTVSGWYNQPTTNTYTFIPTSVYNTVVVFAMTLDCSQTKTVTIISIPCDGISEYELGNDNPVYFDLYGNKVDPKPGILLIRRGRKVLISQYNQ